MKYITVLRHATAAESTNLSSDFNRNLTELGKNDVKIVSEQIAQCLPKIDIIISSSATRAKDTAEILAQTLNFPANKIRIEDNLYDSTSSCYFDVLLSLPTTCHHAIFVGHNAEISDFAGLLINKTFDDLKKGEFAHIAVDTFNWNDVDMGTGKLIKRFDPNKN